MSPTKYEVMVYVMQNSTLQTLHLCFCSLGQQFYMLDLLQLQEPGLNYICYRSPADIRFSWPVKTSGWSRWVQEVDLQVLLHSVNLFNNTNLPLLIVCACDILVQMQGHPTRVLFFEQYIQLMKVA